MASNAQGRVGFAIQSAVFDEHNGIEGLGWRRPFAQYLPRLLRLQRAEPEVSGRVAVEHEIDACVAEVADAVEQYDCVISQVIAGWIERCIRPIPELASQKGIQVYRRQPFSDPQRTDQAS